MTGNTASGVLLKNTAPAVIVSGNTFSSTSPINFYQNGMATFSGNTYLNPKRIGVTYASNEWMTRNSVWSNIEGLGLPYQLNSDLTVNAGTT